MSDVKAVAGKLRVLALMAQGATEEGALRVVHEVWKMGFEEAAGMWEEQVAKGKLEVVLDEPS